jgi:hypothetical protein
MLHTLSRIHPMKQLHGSIDLSCDGVNSWLEHLGELQAKGRTRIRSKLPIQEHLES